MSVLLQEFETPIVADGSDTYRAFLYAQSRPGDTWEGWILFERLSDGTRFSTPVETTQSNQQAVLYWATGLTDAYFEGALGRALSRPRDLHPPEIAEPAPRPLVDLGADRAVRRERLAALEREILDVFSRRAKPRILVQTLFDSLPHANADVVRALEDLEKQGRFLVRKTEEGNDWIYLTEEGLRETGLSSVSHEHDEATIDPPKSVP
jgi:hypothetical protein